MHSLCCAKCKGHCASVGLVISSPPTPMPTQPSHSHVPTCVVKAMVQQLLEGRLPACSPTPCNSPPATICPSALLPDAPSAPLLSVPLCRPTPPCHVASTAYPSALSSKQQQRRGWGWAPGVLSQVLRPLAALWPWRKHAQGQAAKAAGQRQGQGQAQGHKQEQEQAAEQWQDQAQRQGQGQGRQEAVSVPLIKWTPSQLEQWLEGEGHVAVLRGDLPLLHLVIAHGARLEVVLRLAAKVGNLVGCVWAVCGAILRGLMCALQFLCRQGAGVQIFEALGPGL